jgi:cell division protein FtsL
MKKLFKQITLKQIFYLTVAMSWCYFLILFLELKNELHSINRELSNVNFRIESIDQNLEYDYTSVDQNDYESIKHYRINNKSDEIQEIRSSHRGSKGRPRFMDR